MLQRRYLVTIAVAAATIAPFFATATASASPTQGFLTVSPDPVIESDGGDVSLALYGTGFSAGMQVELSSAGLKAACQGGVNIPDPVADYDGNFNVVISGEKCVPGIYRVEASEVTSPYQTVDTEVIVEPPAVVVVP